MDDFLELSFELEGNCRRCETVQQLTGDDDGPHVAKLIAELRRVGQKINGIPSRIAPYLDCLARELALAGHEPPVFSDKRYLSWHHAALSNVGGFRLDIYTAADPAGFVKLIKDPKAEFDIHQIVANWAAVSECIKASRHKYEFRDLHTVWLPREASLFGSSLDEQVATKSRSVPDEGSDGESGMGKWGEPLVSLLLAWHGYDEGQLSKFDPIGVNDAARKLKANPGSITRAFQKLFDGGHGSYQMMCAKTPDALMRAIENLAEPTKEAR